MKLHQIALGLFTLAAMTATGAACAESTLDLNLNSNTARLSFKTPITPTGLYANAGYLYNSDRGDVINAGIHLIGDAGVGPNPLHAGLGGQFYYVNPSFTFPAFDVCGSQTIQMMPQISGDDCVLQTDGVYPVGDYGSGEALAVGGFLQYQLPDYNRIGFGAHIYYAPGVIAFGGLDRFLEYGVRADYQVLRNANVYIGYRQVKADFGADFYNMDSGFHIGMQLNF